MLSEYLCWNCTIEQIASLIELTTTIEGPGLLHHIALTGYFLASITSFIPFFNRRTHTRVHTHTHAHQRARMHARTHACTHARTHTHTCTTVVQLGKGLCTLQSSTCVVCSTSVTPYIYTYICTSNSVRHVNLVALHHTYKYK